MSYICTGFKPSKQLPSKSQVEGMSLTWNKPWFSPQHARSIHLILSLTSACVSPQFHCTFDDHFKTVDDYIYTESSWQEKAHFITKWPTGESEKETTLQPATSSSEQPQSPGPLLAPTQQIEGVTNMDFTTPETSQPPLSVDSDDQQNARIREF
jgi:hypothetical protein